MGWKRSAAFGFLNLEICSYVLIWLLFFCSAQISRAVTNLADVAAINNLYALLGNPVLPGWVASAGDPCGEAWQGVQCNDSDILAINLNAANLGGELGESLGMFSSIRTVDLSNNHIGGVIPSNLPVTLQTFFLSANQFTGSIPSSVSTLTQLSAMSLNNNLLTGEIPDAFQSLTGLANLDLSSNNLSGELPPSLKNLPALQTLHLQNNGLSGTLDVLQDLPLTDLNVENNLFSGSIPGKLLSIPNFRGDGNPFNSTTVVPPGTSPSSPSAPSPPSTPFFPKVPSSPNTPDKQSSGPTTSEESKSGKKNSNTKRVVGIAIAVVLLFIILVLGLVLLMQKCTERREDAYRVSNRHDIESRKSTREIPRNNGSWVQPPNQMEKASKEMSDREENKKDTGQVESIPKLQNGRQRNVQRTSVIQKQEDNEMDMSSFEMMLMPPPPPVEKVVVKSTIPTEVTKPKLSTKTQKPFISARSFTIASLQQYANSFSQDNLMGGGMLGRVYRAQLPDGKLLAIKKLDNRAHQSDDEFLELVNNIDRIRHANVVELMGYCAEHNQRLLIYEYCSNGTLQDALHSDDEMKNKLSWNVRARMALGAARALEYLHEVCQPPVVHRNFKSINILLDDDLAVRVSDCGLASLISSGSVSQLSGQLLSAYGYGAPEFESGIYTAQSDVYSFGVVMLELLTGRASYDRSRNRTEQFLVRWAIPQLHDIDALSRMVDPFLNGEYPSKSLSHFADIISRCVQTEPEFRPLMSEVVQDLQDMIHREPSRRRDSH